MKTETLEYKDRDVRLLGYLAYDDKVSGRRPGVIIMPQVCGPGVHSRTKAEGLAALAYVAFAGDYYGNGRELDTCPTRYSSRTRCSTTLACCADAVWRRSTSWLRSRRSIRRGLRRLDFVWVESFLSSSRAKAHRCAVS